MTNEIDGMESDISPTNTWVIIAGIIIVAAIGAYLVFFMNPTGSPDNSTIVDNYSTVAEMPLNESTGYIDTKTVSEIIENETNTTTENTTLENTTEEEPQPENSSDNSTDNKNTTYIYQQANLSKVTGGETISDKNTTTDIISRVCGANSETRTISEGVTASGWPDDYGCLAVKSDLDYNTFPEAIYRITNVTVVCIDSNRVVTSEVISYYTEDKEEMKQIYEKYLQDHC